MHDVGVAEADSQCTRRTVSLRYLISPSFHTAGQLCLSVMGVFAAHKPTAQAGPCPPREGGGLPMVAVLGTFQVLSGVGAVIHTA